jgi:hypothetical protein
MDSITAQPAEEMRGERWDARRAGPVTSFLSLRCRLQIFKVGADMIIVILLRF